MASVPVPVPVPVPATPAASTSMASLPAPSLPAPSNPLAALPLPAAAPDAPAAPTPEAQVNPSGNWRDGTYTGWGTSRHGDIKAQVVISGGRIVEAGIASCETRYPCDVISDIILQPIARQSPEVDRVSRATESADAYYYGLVEALKEAQVPDTAQSPAPH